MIHVVKTFATRSVVIDLTKISGSKQGSDLQIDLE